MPRKKRRATVRRDPYQRAAEHAQARLEKACLERAKYEQKLALLNEEIPRLQKIIGVFEPSIVPRGTIAPSRTPLPDGPAMTMTPELVAQRFIQPHLPAVVETEDDTLVDALPKGDPILD